MSEHWMFKEKLAIFIYPSNLMSVIIYATHITEPVWMDMKIIYLVFEWASLPLSKNWVKKALPSFSYFKVQYYPSHSGSPSFVRSSIFFFVCNYKARVKRNIVYISEQR